MLAGALVVLVAAYLGRMASAGVGPAAVLRFTPLLHDLQRWWLD